MNWMVSENRTQETPKQRRTETTASKDLNDCVQPRAVLDQPSWSAWLEQSVVLEPRMIPTGQRRIRYVTELSIKTSCV